MEISTAADSNAMLQDASSFLPQQVLPFTIDNVYLGNPNPKLILGWQNIFSIKNCSFSFLIDAKFGGKVLSIAESYMDQFGVSQQDRGSQG